MTVQRPHYHPLLPSDSAEGVLPSLISRHLAVLVPQDLARHLLHTLQEGVETLPIPVPPLSQVGAATVRMAVTAAVMVMMALHPVPTRTGCHTRALPIAIKACG